MELMTMTRAESSLITSVVPVEVNSLNEFRLAYSGVRHHYNRPAQGQIEGYPLQLVQVMHRLTGRHTVHYELLPPNPDPAPPVAAGAHSAPGASLV